MLRYVREYRFYITLFFFLLLPVVALDTQNRAPRDYHLYDRLILALTSPIQSVIRGTLDWTVEGFENYVFVLNTKRENKKLLLENRKLLTTIAELRESEQENIRLKKLLGVRDEFKFETLVAKVVAKDVSTEFRTIRINRGEKDGILKNMAVVTHEGIVGRVLRTTENTSDIVTILDLLSAVDVIDDRSRARGVVEGNTDELCELKFALRDDDIEVGDILISSGLGGIFPKGLPVGQVSKVNRKPFGITQEVEVKPSVNFSKLEEVLIILKREEVRS